jgi:nucleotide-binding universal stress UspA family protein
MIPLRKLLLVTDLGPDSVPALSHARLLAQRFGASLLLYHAVPVPDHRYAHWAFAHGHEVWLAAERHSRSELERQAQTIPGEHELFVERRSSPLEGILDVLGARKPDLAIMGTHGRRGFAHLFEGSVAEEVLERHPCPVLCLPPRAPAEAEPYRRILAPTDMSAASRSSWPHAAFFARSFEAEVTLLHVTGARTPVLPPRGQEALADDLRGQAEEELAGLRLTARVLGGRAYERILETARAESSHLIVMSTRGHDSLSDRILGSTTERVLRLAPCPVLVA